MAVYSTKNRLKPNKMKKIKLMPASVCCIFVMCMIMDGCTKQNAASPAKVCTSNGTSVNIGSSVGSVFATSVGHVGALYENIYFNNTNLNFTVADSNQQNGTILDVGQQTCLDFSYSGTPIANVVAYKKGEGYVGLFKDGHIVKFITISYSGGIALIEYVFQ
jgi:hypothetical protein